MTRHIHSTVHAMARMRLRHYRGNRSASTCQCAIIIARRGPCRLDGDANLSNAINSGVSNYKLRAQT
jgi:hypothetical protein